jgi:cysteine-rich repeat protein
MRRLPSSFSLVLAALATAGGFALSALPALAAPSALTITATPTACNGVGSMLTGSTTNQSSLVFSFSATPGVGGTGLKFTCSEDATFIGPCASPITRVSTNGSHTFNLIATDSTGSASRSFIWTQDTTQASPSVTIAKAAGQANPSPTSPVNFTATFGSAVSTFAGNWVTIGGTAPGALIQKTTGALPGTAFNVAVSGMTGAGSVTASVPACTVKTAAGGIFNLASATTASVTFDPPPTLAQVTPVPSPTNSSSPTYSFSSTAAGTILYGGDCSSGTTSAIVGKNTVTFGKLAEGTHGNCTITVRDAFGTSSAPLSVSAFTIDFTPPVLAEVTPVPPFTNDSTPDYTFKASEGGTITYGGGCASATTSFGGAGSSVSVPLTFNALADGPHNACTIRVTDAAGNASASLAVSGFTIDSTPPTGTVAINGGAATTSSSTVTLTLACADPGSGCASMRVAADGNLDTEPAVPFATSQTVTLPAGQGTRTVVVQFLDGAGNASTATASIQSNSVAPPSAPPGPLPSGFVAVGQFCAGSIVGSSTVCGDGIKGPNEACEIGDVSVAQCTPSGGPTNSGHQNLSCINDNGTCRFQTSAEASAKGSSCVPAQCGNGVVEGSEQCDDGALNGTINHCGADCTLAGSIGCGDGFLAGAEQCDCGTPQNFSTLPGSSWAKLNHCAAANGQYAASGVTCTFDCKSPGAFCGDHVVNGGEVCDGNATTSSTFNGAACPKNTVSTSTCKSDCSGFNAPSACGATCGNGKVEGNEECDDGNTDNNDGCTNSCKKNVCGDGFLSPTEQCDDGANNGAGCSAPYGGTCNACTSSCKLVTKSGGFCGDGTIDAGHELCDGNAPMPKTCVNTSTRDHLTSCTDDTDCQSQAQTAITDGSATGPASNWHCVNAGLCNGGTNNGQTCTVGSSTLSCAGTGATCAAPKCDNVCGTSCPYTLQTSDIQVQSSVPGSAPSGSVDLFSFQNAQGSTPDTAMLLLPACSVGTKLSADIDDSKVTPPSVDIVLMTDMSASMSGGGTVPNRKIDLAVAAAKAAVDKFADAYADHPSQLRIALVSYGTNAHDAQDINGNGNRTEYITIQNTSPAMKGARVDLPFTAVSSASTIKDQIDFYTQEIADDSNSGTPMYSGVDLAKQILAASTANKKVIILLTDGGVSYSKHFEDGTATSQDCPTYTFSYAGRTYTGSSACIAEIRHDLILPAVSSIDMYSGVVSSINSDMGLTAHLSVDACTVDQSGSGVGNTLMQSASDCSSRAGVQYAHVATSASGIAAMYGAITDSVLGANVGITATGGGSTSQTSGSVPIGKGVILPFPTNFACTGAAMQLPFNVSFASDPNVPSTINVSNVKFEYCPAR